MFYAHSVRKPTLGDYSFHIRRPTTSSCFTASWDQFYYKSGEMFAVLNFTYFTKALFRILHSLLSLVFIGWSHTHTQLLHASKQARTHAHTKRIAKLIIYDYYSFSTSRCQAILDLGKRKNWRVWRGLHILMTLLRPQNAINSLTISGKFAFLRKTPFREDN